MTTHTEPAEIDEHFGQSAATSPPLTDQQRAELEKYADQIAFDWPPLTEQQRAELTRILPANQLTRADTSTRRAA